jgi:predicted enzyme related to lactoylglutathione lyase
VLKTQLKMSNATLVSLRMITSDIKQLVSFYELATGITARWATDDFAEVRSNAFTLAIASTGTLAFFGTEIAEPAANRSIIIEFLTENVDDDYERIKVLTGEVVQKPTTMPWGNRSFLFRDPDGNLVNFFTPVSEEARKKFAGNG